MLNLEFLVGVRWVMQPEFVMVWGGWRLAKVDAVRWSDAMGLGGCLRTHKTSNNTQQPPHGPTLELCVIKEVASSWVPF